MSRILVIEDDRQLRENLVELLEAEGYEVEAAADGKLGLAAALARVPDAIVCDIAMPVMDGYEVLEAIRDYPATATVPFVYLTARAERADVRLGMSLGADDYVTKPFSRDDLLASLRARLARAAPRAAPPAPPTDMIIRSEALTRVWERARRVAQTDLAVLVLGETGVGKDVLAHEIHKASPRAAHPFVPLHCAALAQSLLESELFGHDRGAFTGAVGSRAGLFEAADGGTVFLDEIGEVPLDVQVKLLRVLEDRRVTRVGGRGSRQVDIRFIAATNRPLESAVEAGTFRRDLYYRIAGVALEVPPLRDRRDEILPLAERFVASACHRQRRVDVPTFADDARDLLLAHDWPGNVRELRNAVEQAVALADGRTLHAADLPPHLGAARPREGALKGELRAVERQRILDALEKHAGNQTQAALSLGMSRRTFLNRLDTYDVPRPRRRD